VYRGRVVNCNAPLPVTRWQNRGLARNLVPAPNWSDRSEPELFETDTNRPPYPAFFRTLRLARRTPLAFRTLLPCAPRLCSARQMRAFIFERALKPLQLEDQCSALRPQPITGSISLPSPRWRVEMLYILATSLHGQTLSTTAARRAGLAAVVGAACFAGAG
jgi:hypothetical protein